MRLIGRNEGNFDNQWNDYIQNHRLASVYHHTSFRNAVAATYGHEPFYLIALDEHGAARGVLPLFVIKRPLIGRELVSLPFCDYGGLLADCFDTGAALFRKAMELARELRCTQTQLRQTYPLTYLSDILREFTPGKKVVLAEITSKVGMRLTFDGTPNDLFSSFPAKLRAQIRKPMKQGYNSRVGGAELLKDFYSVFVRNMHYLGSPVHSVNLMKNVLLTYREKARLFVVYKGTIPVAGSMTIGFRDTLVNPWASFLREYRRDSPNMLLYWTMLEYAAINGYSTFDFGRSTRDESTYRFKEQWGAKPQSLHWYCAGVGNESIKQSDSQASLRKTFETMWQHLPMGVTAMLGPAVRKYISL
ncbi:MAG: GNAT family N-acetyltransferase [Chitinivibrionales bacterium]